MKAIRIEEFGGPEVLKHVEVPDSVAGVYPLSEAARAHEDLTGRRTSGKLLLDPSK